LNKLGTCLVLKRIWNPQGLKILDHLTSPGLAYSQILLARIYEPLVLVNAVISWIRLADLNHCTMYISLTIFLFRSGIVFYFHILSTVQVTVRPKKICVFTVDNNFFFTIGKIGNSRSRFRNPILVFHFQNFRWAVICWSCVLWRVMQFFFLLCSQFRQKASGWINKTLLLIKQHITYMNISRYVNIDKFMNIQYIVFLARRAYSWLFQLAQMWKLLALGVGLVDFLTPEPYWFSRSKVKVTGSNF
jgi:hypothetical protein